MGLTGGKPLPASLTASVHRCLAVRSTLQSLPDFGIRPFSGGIAQSLVVGVSGLRQDWRSTDTPCGIDHSESTALTRLYDTLTLVQPLVVPVPWERGHPGRFVPATFPAAPGCPGTGSDAKAARMAALPGRPAAERKAPRLIRHQAG